MIPVLLFLLANIASGAEACSFESLTRSCAVFEGPQEKMELSDGTFIPNFLALLKKAESRKIAGIEENEKEKEERTKYWQIKYRLSQLLDTLPKEKLHPLFKIHVIENLLPVMVVLYAKEVPDEKEFQFLWPPDNPQRISSHKVGDFRKSLFSLFSKAQIDSLTALAQESFNLVRSRTGSVQSDVIGEMRSVTQQRQTYVLKLADFVKERIKELITQGRGWRLLSPAEKQALGRIQSVQFTKPDDERLWMSPYCSGILPNAYYDRATHSINLCLGFYHFPDSTLVSVIAHEMAHTIDPCLSQFPIYRVDWAKFAAEEKAGGGGADRRRMIQILREIPQGTEVTSHLLDLESTPEVVRFFEKRGVLKRMHEGVPYKEAVFSDVYACLKSERGGGFSSVNPKKLQPLVREVAKYRSEIREPAYDPAFDEKHILKTLSIHPECVALDRYSQLGEAFSDWVAARVVGEFLTEIKLQSDLERLGPFAYFGNLVCAERHRLKARNQQSVGAILRDVKEDYAKLLDEHPASRSRIDKIYLKDPNIRRALNCPAIKDRPCEHRVARISNK